MLGPALGPPDRPEPTRKQASSNEGRVQSRALRSRLCARPPQRRTWQRQGRGRASAVRWESCSSHLEPTGFRPHQTDTGRLQRQPPRGLPLRLGSARKSDAAPTEERLCVRPAHLQTNGCSIEQSDVLRALARLFQRAHRRVGPVLALHGLRRSQVPQIPAVEREPQRAALSPDEHTEPTVAQGRPSSQRAMLPSMIRSKISGGGPRRGQCAAPPSPSVSPPEARPARHSLLPSSARPPPRQGSTPAARVHLRVGASFLDSGHLENRPEARHDRQVRASPRVRASESMNHCAWRNP